MKKRAFGHWFWIGFFSVLIAAALTCRISLEAGFVPSGSSLRSWISCALNCLGNDRVLTAALAAAVGVFLHTSARIPAKRRDQVVAALFSACFTALQLLGASYRAYHSWDALFASAFTFLRALFVYCGKWALFYRLTLCAFHGMDVLAVRSSHTPSAEKTWRFTRIALILLICWLPHFIGFWPGINNGDTADQIKMFFGYHTPVNDRSAVQGAQYIITNHHPVLTTYLFGGFIRLGLALGDMRWGVSLYVILQMLSTAALIAGALTALRRAGLPEFMVRAVTLFFAIDPLTGMHVIFMVKDMPFALATLALTLLLLKTARTEGAALKDAGFFLALLVCSALFILIKSQALYILLVVLAAGLIAWRRYRLRFLAALLIPVVLYEGIWLRVLLPAWNIAPAGKQELYGMFFQQTARSVVDYPDDVTEEQADVLRAVIDYDHLTELYDPTCHDPVKFTYNQQATSEEISAYFKTWLQMLFRHPDSYLQAWLSVGVHGFDLSNPVDWYYYWYTDRVDKGDMLSLRTTPWFRYARGIMHQGLIFAQRIPFFGFLLSDTFPNWVILFCLADLIRRRKWRFTAATLPVFLQLCILFIAPICSYRYCMPMYITAPILFAAALIRDHSSKVSEILG